ncbi:MAG: aldehyde dehydrogenase family protein [Solirubrobacterales bacterium]|nr:aldehyde dehydrogenase family protein [Solirubrobacterales bacterium]
MTNPSRPELLLPVLVGGERIEPDGDVVRLSYDEAGVDVVLPAVTADDGRRMLESARVAGEELREVSIDDITLFFDQVGRAWRAPDSPWRDMALEWGSRVTGYARPFVEWDVNLLGQALHRAKQYDFLEGDLGDPSLLDEWNRTKAIYTRCWPKGLIAHIMVGNVPMASLFTLYRSLATKNATIAKVPSRDPVMALTFANCLYDVDPGHPVTRALSTLYWEAESELEDMILDAADVVSVWGGAKAVEAVKRRLRYGCEMIEFGPKRSLTVVGEGVTDWERLAVKMAYDLVSYDQEGCFSMQEAFVESGVETLVDALSQALKGYSVRFPRRAVPPDVDALVQRARMEAGAEGWDVYGPDTTEWTIIVTDGPVALPEHPLNRVLYMHPVEQVTDVLPLIDRNVQTVAVDPWERVWEFADALTGEGADRIVQVGRMSRLRPGFIHDGFHPMRRMVRWVALERGLEQKYRFMTHSPEEDEQRIYFEGIRTAEEEVPNA